MRLTRRIGLLTAVALSLLATSRSAALAQESPPPQETPSDVTLLRDVADGFIDRTPLAAPDQPYTEALRHTFSLSSEQLMDAARSHAAARQATLAGATGEARDDLAITRDLLRFPEVSRGRAIELRGVVRDVSEVSLGGGPVTVVQMTPSDAPATAALVLLPPDGEPPTVGDRVQVAGLFLKLVSLSGGEAATATAVLLAAPTIRSDQPTGSRPDPALWSVVRHRTLGVRATESGLYYELLRQAAATDEKTLRQAAKEQVATRQGAEPQLSQADEFPVFVDLFKNPAAYEGQVVTLTGHAREIRRYPAGENAAGLETLYEAWVYTADSQGNPAVIVASAAPEDVPLGEDLQVLVRATGYFFKIYGYEAQDTTRVAPMILAGRLEVIPEPKPQGPPWWLLALLAAMLAALVGWLAISYYGSRKHARRIVTSEEPPDFTGVE